MKKYIVHVDIEFPLALEIKAENQAKAILYAEEAVAEGMGIEAKFIKVGAVYEDRKK